MYANTLVFHEEYAALKLMLALSTMFRQFQLYFAVVVACRCISDIDFLGP